MNVNKRFRTIAWSLAAAGFMALSAPAAHAHSAQPWHTANLSSLSGNYLAGRFAGRSRDNASAADYFSDALKLDPDNDVILEDAFLLEVSAGRIDRAINLARRVIKANPKNRFAQMVIGLSDFRAGRFSRARRHFGAGDGEPVAQLAGRLLTAWSYLAERKPKQALKSLESLTGTQSFDIFRVYHSALLADVGGLTKAANAQYRRANESAGKSLRVVQAYGSFLERSGREQEARELYRVYGESAPDNPLIDLAVKTVGEAGETTPRLIGSADAGAGEALFGIASALADETGIDLALRYMQLALYMRPEFPVGQMLLGDIFEDVRDYESAVETYRKISPSSPLRPNAELQIAENLDRLEKTDEAVEFLRTVAEQRADQVRPLILLGNILRGRLRFDEAAEAYSRAVDRLGTPSESDWTLFYFRGISFERTKQWPSAEADFKKALELNPEQPSVLNYLGYSWVEKGLNLSEALGMIRSAVELRPNDGYIVDSLGWAQYQLADYDQAVENLERAVLLRPEDPVINDHLGDAYWRVGRKREARFQWSYARDLEPEPEDLEQIEMKLKFGLLEAERKASSPDAAVPTTPADKSL